MPDNSIPAPHSDPEVQPGEFDFAKPVEEHPRVRRRSLKLKPAASLKPGTGAPAPSHEIISEAPPQTAETVAPEEQAEPTSVRTTTAQPAQTRSGTASPSNKSTSTQPASPHGTRPATLYYSTGARKEKEDPSPMKSTPTASPAPSTSSTSPTPVRTAASTVRPSSVVDYRTNVERQAREQKSVGGILSILVYSLIGLFVLGALLAGYGAYVVHQALHDQSVTVTQLEARYDAENKDLNAKLATTLDTLTQAQAQINRQQDLLVKQQEAISKLLVATEDNAAALKQEKAARAQESATRAQETASLRARLKDLEYQGPTTKKY